jgi:hypothetical protein
MQKNPVYFQYRSQFANPIHVLMYIRNYFNGDESGILEFSLEGSSHVQDEGNSEG